MLKKGRKKTVILIIISVVALVLVGITTYIWISNRKEIASNYNLAAQTVLNNWLGNRLTQSQKVTDYDTNVIPENIPVPVDDKITYKIPSDWVKENGLSYSGLENDVVLKSPDYESDSLGVGVSNGLEVFFSVSPIPNGYTLETEFNGLKECSVFSDISDSYIDDAPAIKYHSDWDGSVHSIQYYAIKDDYSLLVVIISKDLNTEYSFQNLIDTLIGSIQFK